MTNEYLKTYTKPRKRRSAQRKGLDRTQFSSVVLKRFMPPEEFASLTRRYDQALHRETKTRTFTKDQVDTYFAFINGDITMSQASRMIRRSYASTQTMFLTIGQLFAQGTLQDHMEARSDVPTDR